MIGNRLIVVDLDGTLSNSSHRDHLAQAGQWDEFHALCSEDRVWRDVDMFISIMQEVHQVILCTGRNERWRAKTLQWLEREAIHPDALLMRPDNDFRPDTEVKSELLYEFCGGKQLALTRVIMILEDRDKVVEMWRNEGFRCWQVQPGGY